MTWENFFFRDGLSKQTAEVERRKMWAVTQYSDMSDAAKTAGFQFAIAMGASSEALSTKPRTVKSGQFFLHKAGRYSVIVKDRESSRLRWLDLTSLKGVFVTESVGGEEIGRDIDLDGNWLKVADSKDEFIKLQLEGHLGSNEAARKHFGAKT